MSKNTGKRLRYVISYSKEYDGYEHTVYYIGSNEKAAIERYRYVIEYLKRVRFFNEGVNEDEIQTTINMPTRPLQNNETIYSSISDDNEWITIVLQAIVMNTFIEDEEEQRYLDEHPEAKF